MKEYNYNDLYLYTYKEKDCKFLVNGDKTIIINDDQKKVAALDVGMKIKLLGTKFYSIRDKSFLELDINDIFNNNILKAEL